MSKKAFESSHRDTLKKLIKLNFKGKLNFLSFKVLYLFNNKI